VAATQVAATPAAVVMQAAVTLVAEVWSSSSAFPAAPGAALQPAREVAAHGAANNNQTRRRLLSGRGLSELSQQRDFKVARIDVLLIQLLLIAQRPRKIADLQRLPKIGLAAQ